MVIAGFAVTSFALSTPAHAEGFFDKMFGNNKEEQKGPPPEVTLQAPFATAPDAKAPASKSALMDMYGKPAATEDVNNLSTPHRNEKQIIEWTTEVVTQATTIDLKKYEKDLRRISPFFTPYAMKEYQDYLHKMNMAAILESNNMRLQAISDEEGSVIKDGAIANSYHWLIQIPLMASYYPADQQTVDKNANAQSQNLIVQVQVGRVVPKTTTDIGLIVERWSVSSNAKK